MLRHVVFGYFADKAAMQCREAKAGICHGPVQATLPDNWSASLRSNTPFTSVPLVPHAA